MDNKSVIEKFNEKCAPFYLVDHENGTFSLADMILTTSEGEFLISEDQLKGLRDGKESIAFIGDYEMSAEDFGSMEIQSKHYDSNSRAYRVQADIPEEIIDEGMGGM